MTVKGIGAEGRALRQRRSERTDRLAWKPELYAAAGLRERGRDEFRRHDEPDGVRRIGEGIRRNPERLVERGTGNPRKLRFVARLPVVSKLPSDSA